jgi:hypothetical protein
MPRFFRCVERVPSKGALPVRSLSQPRLPQHFALSFLRTRGALDADCVGRIADGGVGLGLRDEASILLVV